MKTLKLTLLSLTLALTAFAQTVVTKEGTGEAAVLNPRMEPVTDVDRQRAYDEAKLKAERAAIEQAAGVRIEANSSVLNNQLVRDQIYSNTSGFLKKSEVIDKKIEKGVAIVKVRADIITENLDKDIEAAKSLVKRIGRPTIVIVIQEQTLTSERAMANSEVLASALTESFKADGWDVKDEKALNKSLSLEGAQTLGPTELKKIAELSRCDYILYGKSSIRQEAPPMMAKDAPYFAISGEYDLALAATDSDSQLIKVSGALRMSQKTKETLVSYERTAYNVINERKGEIITPVRKAILEHFRSLEVNGRPINLSVKGLESVTSAKQFMASIETITGIKDASQDRFVDGKAAYRLTYLGPADELAVKLEAATFKKKKLLVVSQTGNTLEVQVGK